MLAPVIEALKQLGRYTEAELMAAVVSGMFTVFVKGESAEDARFAGLGGVPGLNESLPTAQPDYALGNGAIVGLGQGESIETANPGRPLPDFQLLVNVQLTLMDPNLRRT